MSLSQDEFLRMFARGGIDALRSDSRITITDAYEGDGMIEVDGWGNAFEKMPEVHGRTADYVVNADLVDYMDTPDDVIYEKDGQIRELEHEVQTQQEEIAALRKEIESLKTKKPLQTAAEIDLIALWKAHGQDFKNAKLMVQDLIVNGVARPLSSHPHISYSPPPAPLTPAIALVPSVAIPQASSMSLPPARPALTSHGPAPTPMKMEFEAMVAASRQLMTTDGRIRPRDASMFMESMNVVDRGEMETVVPIMAFMAGNIGDWPDAMLTLASKTANTLDWNVNSSYDVVNHVSNKHPAIGFMALVKVWYNAVQQHRKLPATATFV